MGWMLLPLKRYADFRGRSRRMEFWMFQVLNVIVSIVLLAFMLAGIPWNEVEAGEVAVPATAGVTFWIGGGLLALWVVAIFVPSIAVTVRRLHDRDMSGLWYLGFIVASVIPLLNVISGIAFLVLTLLPGTPGANRYGLDPKDPYGADVFV